MVFEFILGIIMLCLAIILIVKTIREKRDYGRIFIAILSIIFFLFLMTTRYFKMDNAWKEIQGTYIEPVEEGQYLIEEPGICIYQEKRPGKSSSIKTIEIGKNTIIEVKYISEGESPYVLKYEKIGSMQKKERYVFYIPGESKS